jgi:hypothetical protein
MKFKIILIILILVNTSLILFGDEEIPDEKAHKLLSVDLILGLRYNNLFDAEEFIVADMRAGASLDLIFNINKSVGLGTDAGFYTIYDIENTELLFDIPINGIARFSFGKYFSLEAFGGMYIQGYIESNSNNTNHQLHMNAGARLIIWNFYIEGDYIFRDPGSYYIGAGIVTRF